MLNENIRAARKTAGLSQEEVAVHCHVVRQTVAKWEKGLSVPDADALVRLAEAVNVPVSQLLGVKEKFAASPDMLAEELARVNTELAQRTEAEQLREKAGRVRDLLIGIAFLTLLASMRGENWIFLAAAGVGMVASLIILWRNLGLLTRVTTPGADLKPLRIVTAVSFIVVVSLAVVGTLRAAGVLTMSALMEKWLAATITAGVMAFFGWIAPKLPYNRHTGLRLPWTVTDEDAWNVAHRMLGWIGIPIALMYMAAVAATGHVEAATLIALAAYIGLPGAASAWVFWKKWH